MAQCPCRARDAPLRRAGDTGPARRELRGCSSGGISRWLPGRPFGRAALRSPPGGRRHRPLEPEPVRGGRPGRLLLPPLLPLRCRWRGGCAAAAWVRARSGPGGCAGAGEDGAVPRRAPRCPPADEGGLAAAAHSGGRAAGPPPRMSRRGEPPASAAAGRRSRRLLPRRRSLLSPLPPMASRRRR